MNPEVFTYDTFAIAANRQMVDFSFSVQHKGETYKFVEKLGFPLALNDSYETQSLLQSLHIALGVSYYKLFMPPVIEHPYAMDDAAADFWNKVWQNGLGEFLYVNKLSSAKLARFNAQPGLQPSGQKITNWQQKALLGLGGGKDSIVGGEILKDIDLPTQAFVLATGEQLGQTKDVATTMGVPLWAAERKVDPIFIKLTKRSDAYNGHIPVSIIFALIGSLLAVNKGASYVVVANESSASTPSVNWNGKLVNHQWSKSFEAEQLLQSYLKQTVAPEFTYFSVIRPLNSVLVAKLFAKHPAYFEKFTSDNFVFRIDPAERPNGRWGLESPKSLSSFILLAPWLHKDDLIKIFGRNFLDEQSLQDLFLRLVGKKDNPPLDCVGTVDELRASLNTMLLQQKFTDSYLPSLVINDDFIGAEQPQVKDFIELEDEDAFPPALKDKLVTAINKGLQS